MLNFEPIIEKQRLNHEELEPYQVRVVREYSKDISTFQKRYDFPLRHYNQTEIEFDTETISKIIKRLSIDPTNKLITVFGGYTGQFAECLRDLGCSVIFTDPIENYVNAARKKGFESYCYYAEELPSEIIQKTDLFATFECYMPFDDPSKFLYNTLRLISASYGLIFAESKRTREELRKEDAIEQLKNSFKPFSDNYGLKRVFRESNDIRIYHFYLKESALKAVAADCLIMKVLYDLPGDEIKIDEEFVKVFSDALGVPRDKIIIPIDRIAKTYYDLIPKSMQQYLRNRFKIFSKRFIYDFNKVGCI